MENQTFLHSLLGDQFADQDFKNSFNNAVTTKVFPNHYKLIKTGERHKYVWFIHEGFAMTYLLKEGKRIPVLFWNDSDMIIPINGILKQIPSETTIELLQKSQLSYIHYDDFHKLMEAYPAISHRLQEKQEEVNLIMENRIIDLLSSSAEDRYTKLLLKFPVVSLKVPVELIAAYLGVSRKTLNRIRAKTLRKNRP